MRSIQHLTRNLARIVAPEGCSSTLSKLQPLSTNEFAAAQQFVSLRAFTPSSPFSPATAPCLYPHRSFSASSLLLNNDTTTASPTTKSIGDREWEKQVIYRGRGIQLFRILVRFKIAQLSGVAALAVPMATFFNGGEVSTTQAVVAGALIIGSGIVSTALWYYSRRYVGELALFTPRIKNQNNNTSATTTAAATSAIIADSILRKSTSSTSASGRAKKVRFSVLDFWGNREDVDIDIDDLVPPLRGLPPPVAAAVAGEPFLPITASGDRQYVVSLRYGKVEDKELLKSLLNGSL